MRPLLRIARPAAVFILFLMGSVTAYAADISLDVLTLSGETAIDFGDLESLESDGSAAGGTYTKEVRLIVTSAQTRRYVVSQIVQSPPIGTRGQMFDLTLITCYATIKQGEGELRIAHPTALLSGEREIFFSSGNGGSAEIILVYRIDMPPGKDAGTYNTAITYKVSTL